MDRSASQQAARLHQQSGDPLAYQALSALTSFLVANGSSLRGPALEAISALLSTIEDGLHGNLDPVFYLSSIDPGIGKTLSVSKLLKAWKASGYRPASSVLISVSRLVEIEAYLRHADLDASEIAVLTSDDAMNGLGVPEAAHGNARIMFTTQQMLQSRTRGKASFADAADFHFHGKPRPLRIWDETIMPAEPVTIRVDDLGQFASPLRKKHGKFVMALQATQSAVWASQAGQAITLPRELAAAPPSPTVMPEGGLRETLKLLPRSAGLDMLVVDGAGAGQVLAGGLPALPADFAPAIILDASGRVRSTYSLWQAERGTLRYLPSATNDYSDLAIHLWPHPVGRDRLRKVEPRSEVAEAIAEVINRDDESRWLIVHYKDAEALFDQVRQLVRHDSARRLDRLTWGMHHGTNEFRAIENVVIVGQPTYGRGDYEAHVIAASGRIGEPRVMAAEAEEVRRGEFQHHLLQAVCRSAVRRSVDGVAGYARVFMVCSPFEGLQERIAATFLGCGMFDWAPDLKPLTGLVGQAADYILKRFAEPGVAIIPKKEVREHLGISGPHFAQNVVRHETFRQFLGRNHIVADTRSFTSYKPDFGAVEGGGWTMANDPDLLGGTLV